MGNLTFEPDANWALIPEHMHEGIRAYIDKRRRPGGFLQAVLKNDLLHAVTRADPLNLVALRGWMWFLHDYVPAPAWGSEEKVEAWLADKDRMRVIHK